MAAILLPVNSEGDDVPLELTRESIRSLLDLQRVDSAIDRLNALQRQLPEQVRLDELTAQLEQARKAAAEKELAFGTLSRETARLEAEVSSLEQKIDHESKRLYGGEVSSPKELTSIQAELDALRRRKSGIEDSLLDVMEKRDEAEKALGESKAAASSLEQEHASATAARDDAAVHIGSELIDRQEERAKIVPSVPEEALEIYEEIRPKREGVAVALLEGGVCRGCMVSLSPMALDEIRRSDDPLVRCENCRRLLVIA